MPHLLAAAGDPHTLARTPARELVALGCYFWPSLLRSLLLPWKLVFMVRMVKLRKVPNASRTVTYDRFVHDRGGRMLAAVAIPSLWYVGWH